MARKIHKGVIMRDTCKLSIIVPVYQTEKYLNVCIDSLVNQTLNDIEIILVDDGSPDSSPSLCDQWAAHDNRIKVIHKNNEGLGLARNSGLEIATGEYVTFVDSDDYVEIGTYEYLFSIIEKENLDLLRYDSNRFEKEGSFDRNIEPGCQVDIIKDKATISKMAMWLFGYNPSDTVSRIFYWGSACMEIVRRQIIVTNNIKFVSERKYISEDYLFTYSCYRHCTSFGFTYATMYHYRYNESSLSRKIDSHCLEKHCQFCLYISEMMSRDGYGLESKIVAMSRYINELRSVTKLFMRSNLPEKEKKIWFRKNMNSQYMKEIYENFPWKKLPLSHKIHFLSCYYKQYYIVKILTLFQNK